LTIIRGIQNSPSRGTRKERRILYHADHTERITEDQVVRTLYPIRHRVSILDHIKIYD